MRKVLLQWVWVRPSAFLGVCGTWAQKNLIEPIKGLKEFEVRFRDIPGRFQRVTGRVDNYFRKAFNF